MRIFKYGCRGLAVLLAVSLTTGPVSAQDPLATDLIAFAQGVLPVAIGAGAAPLRVEMSAAVAMIDGNPSGFVVTQKPGTAADIVEITFVLPALTRFSRFAVPAIYETPSPSQTFFRNVEVLGSDASPDGPFTRLATGTLATHSETGMETDLVLAEAQPEVLWVKLRLWDGISVERDVSFFEFSELIGNGTQRAPDLSEHFGGVWSGRGVKIELAQEAATVSGCYDSTGRLTGTVAGNVLRGLGRDDADIPSQFILIAPGDGTLRGLRSTNGAPFKPYDGETSTKAPVCLSPEPPTLGCGAVLHGIGFDYDSDVIRPESHALIAALFEGLRAVSSGGMEIVGHSSSEGAAEYNRELSQRRAQSVVAALVGLGLDPARISATGRGEDEPIASNDDEAGRSLNRRVEVRCAG